MRLNGWKLTIVLCAGTNYVQQIRNHVVRNDERTKHNLLVLSENEQKTDRWTKTNPGDDDRENHVLVIVRRSVSGFPRCRREPRAASLQFAYE